jgi:pimeloyl-ACP methyl ester carboxylesterase
MMRRSPIPPLLIAAYFFLAASSTHAAPEPSPVCRRHAQFLGTEQQVLRYWAYLAGGNLSKELRAHITDLERTRNIQPYVLISFDKQVVHGLKASFADPATSSSVAVLIASGNVATAEFMFARLEPVVQATQHDYYFLDYRGYGRSKDRAPSIRASIQDLVEMGKDLRRRGYAKVFAYAPSFGGVLLLSAAASGLKLDKLVVDSVPSTLADYDCADFLAPVNSFVESCPQIFAVTSENDKEIVREDQEEFLTKVEAQSCGGHVIELLLAGHALNDSPGTPEAKERMDELAKLFAEEDLSHASR